MSREEAIRIYLDVQLGFRCTYSVYLAAADCLNEHEKQVLQHAASGARTDPGLFLRA